MLPAGVAKLLGLHPVGVLFFVFRRGVIAILAITALQSNDFPHNRDPFSSKPLS
jgi:hypothetical protein